MGWAMAWGVVCRGPALAPAILFLSRSVARVFLNVFLYYIPRAGHRKGVGMYVPAGAVCRVFDATEWLCCGPLGSFLCCSTVLLLSFATATAN